ncbi:hypothetical protein [Pedobacter sp. MW01-1-1]|uniref:hypothetical protein n=1 Tax=Pedobacter sp. MW01-1-1 TaxID=3383027 RepID=UPI003FEF5CCD
MKKISIAISMLICLLACKELPKKEIIIYNQSFSYGFQAAQEENKGLILISNKAGCTMCELFGV